MSTLRRGCRQDLRILFVASECAPYAMTGGLGDVAGALPTALGKLGLDVRVAMPLYQSVDRRGLSQIPGTLQVSLGATGGVARVWEGRMPGGVPIYFLEYNPYFAREWPYGPKGGAYPDNLDRFAFFSRAALEIPGLVGWSAQVLHCNDWQTALIPMYLDCAPLDLGLRRCSSLLTIHNLGFQGDFPLDAVRVTGLGREHLHPWGLEHHGALNALKGGMLHATLLSTVSPQYAKDVQTAAFGFGLDDVLRFRARDLFGVLNGIDVESWDPQNDPHLAAHFNELDLSGKAVCKAALQKEAGLTVRPEVPLVGLTTRLTHQKGLDLVAQALPGILDADIQVVLLGAGEQAYEAHFRNESQRFTSRFQAWTGDYDVALAHRIVAGCDLFLMPSRYEPCGLSQMHSMRYGTLPIVSAVGGLADTVQDLDPETGHGTGFLIKDLSAHTVYASVCRAAKFWREQPAQLRALQQRTMLRDHSWDSAARFYAELYERAWVRRSVERWSMPPVRSTRVWE